ncbi:hypothetical protein OKA04_21990 [Luteolibacter flavescens]|uniref:Uncharacterized protein n=1 Tax=Luteolibacter flavescens TaxID=1859460 RepID=A0ABT3FV13_9BACT|nr:hypothetical protein [Luteolibacter flavescens]MCW1887424.1 hypothetical protein [Luteolibacter flavescens]
MSKRVIFTCVVLFIFGLQGSYETLNAFLLGKLYFNVGALFLPVSILLFLGIRWSRALATAVFTIGYLFLLAVAFFSRTWRVFSPAELPVSNPDSFMILIVMIMGSVLALLHWMLFSPAFEDHLGLSDEKPGEPT